jgi:hypothetical protein
MKFIDYLESKRQHLDSDFFENALDIILLETSKLSFSSQNDLIQLKQLTLILMSKNIFLDIFEAKKQKTDILIIASQLSEELMNNGLTPLTFSFFLSYLLYFFNFSETYMDWVNPFEFTFSSSTKNLRYIDFGFGTNIETLNDYEISGSILNQFKPKNQILYIPNTIKKINKLAFENKSFQVVVIPKTVTQIDLKAFMNCKNLTTVIFEEPIEHLEDEVFSGCSSLSSMNQIHAIKHIGKNALLQSNFQKLDEEKFEYSDAFISLISQVSKLSELRINTVETLKKIKRPINVDTLKLSENINILEENILSGFVIENLIVESKALEIFPNAFNNSNIQKIHFTDSTYSILEDVFLVKSSSLLSILTNTLDKIVIPNQINHILKGSINNLNSLEILDFNEHLIKVETNSISQCPKLHSLIIRTNSFSIFENAFIKVNTLDSVEILQQHHEVIHDALSNTKKIILSKNFNEILPYQFANLTQLESINLDHINTIDDYAFYNCRNLSYLNLENISFVGFGAFSKCIHLEKIRFAIPSQIMTKLGPKTFGSIFDIEAYSTSEKIEQYTPKGQKNYFIPKALTHVHIVSNEIPYGYFSGLKNTLITFENPVTKLEPYSLFNTTFKIITLANNAILKDYSLANNSELSLIENLHNAIEISNNVFFNCSSLLHLHIQIPNYDISIKELKTLSSLESINFKSLSNSKLHVLDNMIYDTSNEEVVYVPPNYNPTELKLSNIRQLSKNLMRSFVQLESVEIENVEIIDDYAFNDCTSLKKVIIHPSVKMIGKHILNNLEFINQLTLPFIGQTIEDSYIGSFYEYYSEKPLSRLETLHVNSGDLSNTTFNQLEYLNSFRYSGFNTVISDNAFKGLSNLKNIYFKNGITRIGDSAFANCNKIEFDFNHYPIVSIGKEVFKNCRQFTKIVFNNSLESIGDYCFSNCENITHIDLPFKQITIGTHAFETNSKIIDIRIPLTSLTFEHVFGSTQTIKTLTLYSNQLEPKFMYQNPYVEHVIIDGEIDTIPIFGFANCKNLKQVNLLSKIKFIDVGAFMNSSNLAKITSLEHTIQIGENAFSDCYDLKEISLPNVEIINNGVFKNCSNLENVRLSRNTYSLGDSAFENCKSLSSLSETQNIIDIGHSSFMNCVNIKDLSFPKLKLIKEKTFESCHSLLFFEVSNSCTLIEENAFSNCIKILKITIPRSVNYIYNFAFENSNPDLMIVLSKRNLSKMYQKHWNYRSRRILDDHSFFQKISIQLKDKYKTIEV